MSELFNYTPSGSIASASGASITVAPNSQGERAAAGLTNLIGTSGKAYTQYLEEETLMVQAQTKSVEAKQKAVDFVTSTEITTKQNALFTDYQQQLGQAGDDWKLHEQLTANHQQSQLQLLQGQRQEVLEKVSSLGNKLVRDTIASNSRAMGTLKKKDFTDKWSQLVPAMAATSDPVQQKAFMDAIKEQSDSLNLNFGETSKDVIKSLYAFKVSNLDMESIINNLDYTGLNDIENTLKGYVAMDSKNSVVVADLLSNLSDVKNKVDAGVVALLEDAKQAKDEGYFNNILNHALQNGVMSKTTAHLERMKFFNNKFGERNQLAEGVQALMRATGGKVDLNALAGNPDAQKEAKKSVKAGIYNALSNLDKVDTGFLNYHSNYNPGLIKEAASDKLATLSGNFKTVIDMPAKTPEEIAAKNQELAKLSSQMDKLKSVTFGTMSDNDNILTHSYKAVVNGGSIGADPTNLQKLLDSTGGVVPITAASDDNIAEITKNVPLDKRQEAIIAYSAYVQSNFNKSTALDGVLSTYSNREIDGNKAAMSSGAIQTFGVGEGALQLVEKTLLNTNTWTTAEDKAEMAIILKGNNPRYEVGFGGMLFLKNDEGASIPFQGLTGEKLETFKQFIKDEHNAGNQEAGIARVTRYASLQSGVFLSNSWSTLTLIGKGVVNETTGLFPKVTAMAEETVGIFKKEASLVNKFIEDLAYSGKTPIESFDTFYKSWSKIQSEYERKVDKKSEESIKATQNTREALKQEFIQRTKNTENSLESIFDFLATVRYGRDSEVNVTQTAEDVLRRYQENMKGLPNTGKQNN